jgi:hypothetical protein
MLLRYLRRQSQNTPNEELLSSLFQKMPKVHNEKGDLIAATDLARSFAEATLTEPRLEQAWDYLRETGMKGMGTFVEWLQRDIMVEEKTELGELGIKSPLLTKQIVRIGKPWFIKRVQETESL